jgi:3-oxoacyl-[acyl-carrier protein] reductase
LTKKALVIGSSRGIGRALAIRLASDGFDIVGTARKISPDLEETAQYVRQKGRIFDVLTFDVGNYEEAQASLNAYFSEESPDVIVYNAGIAQDNLLVFMTAEQWNGVMNTNVNGFFNTIQPLLFGLLARKSGRIVVISSASGQVGHAGQVNYSAAKAALIGAAKALAKEIGKKGILVNVVAPGFIDTDMTADLPKEKILPLIPLNRAGTVEDVAGVVSFLCGLDSNYIHGQVIAVNGGLVI